jgi:hypothetical protein
VTKPFLKVQLVGGLGNQLFQWATSTSIASKKKLNLIGDPSFLREGKSPLIELNLINEDLFSRNWIPSGIRGSEFHRKYINRFVNNLVHEGELFKYDPSLHHLKENSTIRGFFQSWKYFDDISDEIKFKLHASFKDKCMFGESGLDFKGEQTIAIHIRRGDYAQLKDSFGLLGKNYYLKSLEIASSAFPRANVVVFSDEVDVAREMLPFADRYIGPNSGLSDFETIILMSRANAVIGANSSFSWWAAYLMNHENALRVFPGAWFKNFDSDFSDLIPPSWVKVDSHFI